MQTFAREACKLFRQTFASDVCILRQTFAFFRQTFAHGTRGLDFQIVSHFDPFLTPFQAFLTHLRFNFSPILNLVRPILTHQDDPVEQRPGGCQLATVCVKRIKSMVVILVDLMPFTL